MKITDFALIFIGVTLPIIIVVYVNISFVIKAFEQEMYYQKVVDSALRDAITKMKEVESNDPEYDYGYSGTVNNKINVNAKIAVDTFLNSIYNNFNIKGNIYSQEYIQTFIPAIAIFDYNGVYISSIESYKNSSNQNVTTHTVKPKRYYSYTYGIDSSGKIITDYVTIKNKTNNLRSIHNIEFTMDDMITHTGEYLESGKWKQYTLKSFYISDNKNNSDLTTYNNATKKEELIIFLQNKRKEVIVDVITKELSYAVNNNNFYARSKGITYNFVFPKITQDEMYSYVDNVGMLAFVQGLSVGNKYLNYKSHGTATLELTTKYYFSLKSNDSKYKMNLYHKDKECPEFKVSDSENLTPEFVLTKQQAASAKITKKKLNNTYGYIEGFYPCQICRP